jgi:hypothetical protein
MKTIDIEISLGKVKEDGNDVYGEGLTEEQINKIIERVMSEPTFRRGKLDTQIYIRQIDNENEIIVDLGLFDVWGGENSEEEDVWGDYPTKIYQLSDF